MGKKKNRLLGWREWLGLPELGIERIKAKVDTGARTSVLHAFDIKPEIEGDVQMVAFGVQPLQRDDETVVRCRARLIEYRDVTSSNGQTERRPVVQTTMTLGPHTLPLELTLTERHGMRFRMLLGRRALRRRFLIDASRSYLMSSRDL